MSDRKAVSSSARQAMVSPRLETGCAAAVLLWAGLLTAPARADDLPNPQATVHVSGRDQSPGRLPQGAGVLDRARPEYDALGLPVGSFLLFPTLAAGMSYDDNILRVPGAPLDDVFWTFSPRLDLRSQWSQDLVQLYAQADDYEYDSHSSESRTNWIGGAKSEIGIAPGTLVDARLSYFDTHESRGSPDISTAALSPTSFS